jgi:3-hydroxy-5-phosphonooxypentane-2,4-dione thiolase
MPDNEDLTGGARFAPSVPARQDAFPLKGCGALDWGMQSRLARVFRPATQRTVMLAIDHGYFQGPTTGLERVDLSIVPLLPYADALMTTRGMIRSTIPAASGTPVVLRASGGASVLKELSNEQVAVSMEDAARINACAVAVQVFIGGEFETQSVRNLTRLVDQGQRYGIPVLAVTAVGRELTRDARYLRLATRICAELGAHFVKTYYCEPDFDTVVAACPVPLVMAGGKKLPEPDALTMAYHAVSAGAAGVDMGRNIFQSDTPEAMIRAVGAVVHESMKPDEAYARYLGEHEAVGALHGDQNARNRLLTAQRSDRWPQKR